MGILKDYTPPEIVFIVISEDIITGSIPLLPGENEGELPFQPFY